MLLDRPSSIAARLVQPLWLVLTVLLVWFLLESLLFRSGYYYRFLAEPNSNAGAMALRLERVRREATTPPRVLVFGDSRVGEGFSEPVAEAVAPDLAFVSVGVPGSGPRAWFYLLRELQRRKAPFDAVVVGVLYSRGGGELANWPLDPVFMAPLVDVRDARSFPVSFPDAQARRRAQETVWLPALAMQKDVQSLIASPQQRWKALKGKRWWLENASNYPGRDERMPALEFSASGNVLDWKEATAAQKTGLEQHLEFLSFAPEPSNDDYHRFWFGKMLELTRAQGVPLIFYPYPRGPYPAILPKNEGLPPSLRELAKEPGIVVLPADFLVNLESPEYFFDALHANREGRRLTSEAIAHAVTRVLENRGAPGQQDARR